MGDLDFTLFPFCFFAAPEILPANLLDLSALRHVEQVCFPKDAWPLLDLIAPEVERPLSYRQGGAPPLLLQVGEEALFGAALRAASELDGLLAVIAPRSLAEGASAGETFDESSLPVLTAREAKGLEFDHVVVVEPALIVAEGGDSGLRELYVALTRPTKTLTVVHARPLPTPLG